MNKVESPIVNCTVFGQTCDSGDIICSNVSMELPSVNDKLIFKNIGAYSMTKDFNGFYDADIVT
jgi:diaminopimelate decarboxylase